ncbi:MAG: sel1 repeat family protein [Psychrobacter sp.]|nr:sel1 repeat family protein [Psychrobacter sp.]
MKLKLLRINTSFVATISVALLSVTIPAIAGNSSIQQLEKKPIDLSVMQSAANKGEIQAQLMMGIFHHEGSAGLTKDSAKAFNWYKKAAQAGNQDAQFSLASMYESGDGIDQNYALAKNWYEKAAAQGDSDSQYVLGSMYYNGTGVAQNYTTAFNWYQKSANQGNMAAENNLGDMYRKGEGVAQDVKKAFSWYQKSAEQGYPKAQYNAAMAYINGIGVKKDSKQGELLLSEYCNGNAAIECSNVEKT